MQDEITEPLGTIKVTSKKLVCEIDGHELACIIAEKSIGIKRPEGTSAETAMQGFDTETRQGFYDAAWAAAKYVSDQIAKAKPVN